MLCKTERSLTFQCLTFRWDRNCLSLDGVVYECFLIILEYAPDSCDSCGVYSNTYGNHLSPTGREFPPPSFLFLLPRFPNQTKHYWALVKCLSRFTRITCFITRFWLVTRTSCPREEWSCDFFCSLFTASDFKTATDFVLTRVYI